MLATVGGKGGVDLKERLDELTPRPSVLVFAFCAC